MTTHIAKLYKFTPEKFLEFCKEVYEPEEKTVKKCTNNHKNSSGKFCKDCGSPLTDETIVIKKSDEYIMDSIWNDMDASCYYANTNISLEEEEIIFFLNLCDIGDEFTSLTEINNVIENSNNDKDEYSDLLEKYCESYEYGVIESPY